MHRTAEKLNKLSGIYCIIHRESLMVYVGSSVNIQHRYYVHLHSLRKGSEACIHRALRKFGPDAFDFEVLERVPKEKLLEREKFWISFFNAASIEGFNTRKNPVAVYDKTCSEATRQRRSLSMRGRVKSPEHLKNLAASLRGNKLSAETREKLRQANLGKKHTAETRAKMSSSHRGRATTASHRASLSASLTGRVFSEAHRAAMSLANKGKRHSPESIEKMRIVQSRRRAKEAEARHALQYLEDKPLSV